MARAIMRPMMRLVIDSRLQEIRRAAALVEEFKALHGLAEEDSEAIHIVLDEVLSNSIRHGLNGAASHEIAVTLDLSEGEIVIEVEDDGAAYDLSQAVLPTLAGTLEERKASGLGVTFVRALTNTIEYQRVAGRNRLVLRRRIAPRG